MSDTGFAPSTPLAEVELHEEEVTRAPEPAADEPVFADKEGVIVSGVFKEVLDDPNEPIPTYEELERFGLFDLSTCTRLLAEYRLAHPAPLPPPSFATIPTSPSSESKASSVPLHRPAEPQHRHSLSVVPLSLNSLSPPLASPPLAYRANPFNLVRNSTLRPRPSQRAKSTGDVSVIPDATTLATLAGFAPIESANSRSLPREDTVKENRGPRKLRKHAPPKITLRTDDEYLLRPFAEASNIAPKSDASAALSESASSQRPSPARRQSWRSGTSSVVSSSLAYDFAEGTAVQPRSPSPVSAFPSGIRREALPPVERKKRDSGLSSSESLYLADSERACLSPRVERASNRFSWGAVPSSPTGSSSSSSVWSRALKLGAAKGKRSGSRPSSVASFDSPATPITPVSFEVVGRLAHRPRNDRSMFDDAVPGLSDGLAGQAQLSASVSTPNLSRILEQPETPDKRASVVSTTSAPRRLVHAASVESLPPSSGVTTPVVLSASSSTTIREGSSTPVRPALPRSRCSSNLVLASSSASHSGTDANAEKPASAPPTQGHFPSMSSLSLNESYRSSYSQSQDSLFYSGDELANHASEVEDELTGASSAQEDDEGPDDARRLVGRKDALRTVSIAPVVVDQGQFVSSTIAEAR